MKKILVTGAAGLIGARFVDFCSRVGLPVVSVDETNHFIHRLEHRAVDFGTIVDRNDLFPWLEENSSEIESIVHLGAKTDTTETDRVLLKEFNLEYSQRLWGVAVRRSIPLVYASSAATFGNGSCGYDDAEALIDRLSPLNPYGESKHAFDRWVLEREREGQAPPYWSGFKFFNVFGFGERHKQKMSSVVLKAFDQLRTSGMIRLFKSYRPEFSDGGQKRDFIWVEDVVKVLHFARTKPISRGIFNLGTGKAHTFLEFIRPLFEGLALPEKIEFIEMPPTLREQYQYFTEAKMDRLRSEGYSDSFTPLSTAVKRYVDQLARF